MMERTTYTLKLEIPMEIWLNPDYHDKPIDPIQWLAGHLQHERYSDGRYPFDRELFVFAFNRLLKDVLSESVLSTMLVRYENQMVPWTNAEGEVTGETSRAYLEQEKWMNEVFRNVGVEQEGWKVSVEPREDR